MKTIIKYELVINEALRSALNYHTPDEQINEFIRFFGRHIGSDRIYIFEDCKERHGTDNTYEWCAQGVIPEIDRLQNVDMDVIKWWYDTFSKGESIIIADIEDIKEEHRMSYDMLKAQNVRNVVVCPLRYKDEISGFFGVDNPPKSDYKGLTTFLGSGIDKKHRKAATKDTCYTWFACSDIFLSDPLKQKQYLEQALPYLLKTLK